MYGGGETYDVTNSFRAVFLWKHWPNRQNVTSVKITEHTILFLLKKNQTCGANCWICMFALYSLVRVISALFYYWFVLFTDGRIFPQFTHTEEFRG